MNLPPRAPTAEDVYEEVRARVAFEHMLVSVLAGAGISGAASFLINVAFAFAKGAGWSLLGSVAVGAVAFAFLIFLVGFAASVAFGVPLFMALEKARRRGLWPYLSLAMVVEFAALMLFTDTSAAFTTPATALFFAPGVLISVLFWRRMRPVWQAAARGQQPAAAGLRLLH